MSKVSKIDLGMQQLLSRRRFLAASAGAAVVAASIGRYGIASAQSASVTTTANGTFLDPGMVHEIAVTFVQADYDAVIDAYVSKGDKEWLKADLTIDGAAYSEVGLRLKGNSSLMGLRMNGANGPQPDQQAGNSTDAGESTPVAGSGNVFQGGGPGGTISADKPESLPWLIRLDKYVDDQNHQGLSKFVIRSNNSKTSLNEAVALELLMTAGLASQQAASAAFSANGGAPALRLAIENPDDQWMAAHFSADGLLYKSESTGDWSYRGDDAASYNDIFDLEAGGVGDDNADFAPLTAFLDFLNNSDDATFTSELPQRLDTAKFAVYLAMMDLTDNFDDIDGPGNNSYLYTPGVDGQFTIVPWDMNLAFNTMGGGMRIAGGPMNGGMQPPEGSDASGNGPNLVIIDPASGTPTAIDGEDGPTFTQRGPDGTRAGGPGGMSNPLVKRFNAVADYAALVESTSSSLRADLFTNGAAATILARWVGVLKSGATAMVDQATITSESEAIAAFFTAS